MSEHPCVTVYFVKAATLHEIECTSTPKTWAPVDKAGKRLIGVRVRKAEPGKVAETPEEAWTLARSQLSEEWKSERQLEILHKQRREDIATSMRKLEEAKFLFEYKRDHAGWERSRES